MLLAVVEAVGVAEVEVEVAMVVVGLEEVGTSKVEEVARQRPKVRKLRCFQLRTKPLSKMWEEAAREEEAVAVLKQLLRF
jgi:hypothetical protein